MTEARERVRGASRAMVVWWFRTRRSEQEAQARGLLKALDTECPIRVYAAPVVGPWKAWRSALRRHYPAANLPNPDLLLGTGREAHWAMLAARWARGGRIVTLAAPQLPRWLFDLCVLPEHEGARNSKRVFATRGALPQPFPPRPRAQGTGLIVVGGPGGAHRGSDDELLAQVSGVLSRAPDHRWFITTTARTSAETEQRLHALAAVHVHVVPHHEADPHWLLARMQEVEQVWVSEDNLDGIYQALNAGAAVGVLAVHSRTPHSSLTALADLVVTYAAWQAGAPVRAPQPPFNEAARCAAEIARRWLSAEDAPHAALLSSQKASGKA